MTSVRKASSVAGAGAATGFWGGMTVGRLFLSLLTSRVGELYSMLIYLGLTIGLELIFWLVPNLAVSAVAAALMGVFMGKSRVVFISSESYMVFVKASAKQSRSPGPMFPTAVVLITKLLPRHLHVGTIGFATAFGGSGGAIMPFVVGAIAQSKGIETLQPVILAICVLLALLWAVLLRAPRKDRGDSDRETTSSEF